MSSTWYHRRWGYFSNAKGRKPKIAIAGRRLKYPCKFCEKPILKGEEYRISYYKPDFYQPSEVDFYAHERCYKIQSLENNISSLEHNKPLIEQSKIDERLNELRKELDKLRREVE